MVEIVRRAAVVSAEGQFAGRVGLGNGTALPALRARPGGGEQDASISSS